MSDRAFAITLIVVGVALIVWGFRRRWKRKPTWEETFDEASSTQDEGIALFLPLFALRRWPRLFFALMLFVGCVLIAIGVIALAVL